MNLIPNWDGLEMDELRKQVLLCVIGESRMCRDKKLRGCILEKIYAIHT